MAEEQYVTRDQQRADLTALRGELKEEVAGLRQDIAVIAKTVEMGFAELRQQMSELRQGIREVRTTSQRQLWVLIGVVIVTVVGGMVKIVFFS